jgi:hypothetical protein
MIEDEKNFKLLKEVLARANKKEKQEYENISSQQCAIAKSLLSIKKEFGELTKESKQNKYPDNAPRKQKPVSQMSSEEFNDYMREYDRYFNAHFQWAGKCIENNTKRIEVVGEFLKALFEIIYLQEQEKCLLLSVALRSQPNLLRYIK